MRFATSDGVLAEQQVDTIILPVQQNNRLDSTGQTLDSVLDGNLLPAL
jgi:hypothetical protein